MIITLAGHVDHGKTAIVQALTGTNTDRLKEEQERGLTIDLGFAYTNFDSQRVGFVDVPGHHRFLHNMIAGVANQQHALLVVAADDGIMPQTIEHTQILQLLGIQSGTIVLNKVDLVSSDRIEECHQQLRTLASSYFLKGATIFDVVATEHRGITELQTHLATTAQTFTQQAMARPFRMPIDRSFSLQGVGTVVTGTIASGQIRVGSEVHLTSTADKVRIRSLNVQGEDADVANVGDRCSLNLTGSTSRDAQRGDWLLEPTFELPLQNAIIDLTVLNDFPRKVKHWSSVHVYHLTDHTEARLSLLEQSTAEPGSTTLASLTCARGMHFKERDRLILRDRDLSRTIGGATVLANELIQTRRIFRSKQTYFASLRESLSSQPDASTFELRASHDLVQFDDFTRFAFCNQEDVEAMLHTGKFVHTNKRALASEPFEQHATEMLGMLTNYHSKFPGREGATLQELVQELTFAKDTIEFVVEVLTERKQIRSIGGRIALSNHRAAAINYDKALFRKIEPLFDAPQPVSLGDVAKRLAIPFNQLERTVRSMALSGVLVQINKNRYLTPERLRQLQQIATDLATRTPFTVREFRDASGLGRNTVIDVLEHFDRERITQRRGETRVLLNQNRSSKDPS